MTDTSRDCAAAGATFVNFLFDGRAAFEVGIARYRSPRARLPRYKSQNTKEDNLSSKIHSQTLDVAKLTLGMKLTVNGTLPFRIVLLAS